MMRNEILCSVSKIPKAHSRKEGLEIWYMEIPLYDMSHHEEEIFKKNFSYNHLLIFQL